MTLACQITIGQDTYRDNFNSVSYSNNDGNQNFSTNWIEIGDTDLGPSSQYIQISSNRLEFYYIWGENIIRSADLSGASSATLSFDWQAISLGGSRQLAVQISNNGGGSYTTIGTISGNNNSGSFNQDITAYISANTTVRFLKSNSNWRNDDYAFIDNFQISTTTLAPRPIMEVDDITVDEDAGTLTFTVTHTGNDASGPFNVTYQTSNVTASAGSDYNSNSGTLNFNGNSGRTRTVTITITDDTLVENAETFTLNIISVSDPDVDITDVGIGTINDDDSITMTNGTTVNECGKVFLDPGGLSDYGNNQNMVYTICPDVADTYISIDFTSFDVRSGDILYIYEGTNTSGTLIGQYDNNNIPSTVNSNHTSGCLTFRFTSNNNTTGAGWEAPISCIPDGPEIIIDDITFDEDIGNAIFTVRSTRAPHGRNIFLFGFVETPFTVDFQTVDGSALAGSDYTATSGTLTFNGEVGNVQTISIPIVNDGIPEISESFSIEFTGANAPDVPVNYSDTGTGTINSQILANDPLTLFQEFDGYYDYSTTGGSLRTMQNGQPGEACLITTSSSNQLISPIPATATIEKAYLYWAHSSGVMDQQVTFEGQTVNAGYIYQTTLTTRNFYGYVSDVTSIVQGVPNPSTNVFDFSDLTIDNSSTYCSSETVLGGWTLMVFYEDKSLPAVNINLYQGFDGFSNAGTSFTLDSFYAIAGSGAKATFLSWEGDATLDGSHPSSTNPEELSITNQANTTFVLSGDGGQPGNNAYNSTIYDNTVGPVFNSSTSYGVDLDTYDISSYISPGDSQVTANVDAGQDFVISAAVVLKVPTNLIAGTVFEDINYPGGQGRDHLTSSGIGIQGSIVELFDSSGNFVQRKTTDVNGNYSFGGMADGDYSIKVVNGTVRSTRGGGNNCSSCYPVQTFRVFGSAGALTDVVNEVGGKAPAANQDVALGVLVGAQSVSDVSVAGNGVAGIDFGFNFNTIVNTNEDGQGSLEQFIINSNNLNEAGLDVEPNVLFDPNAGEDISIFMIPPSGDTLGRSPDANYSGGFFDINISNGNPMTTITDNNTVIDGRTQTAYSGDSNSGNIGSGGINVGVSAITLPNYSLPEVQVHRDNGDVFKSSGSNVTIRNLAIFANNNTGVRIDGGSIDIQNNLLGLNASGINAGNIDIAIENLAGSMLVDSNYIATNTDSGIVISGGSSSIVQNNHITSNGDAACDDNILISGGSGIVIQQNLIENAASLGIDAASSSGDLIILENTITGSGQDGGNCGGGPEDMGIDLAGSNSQISNNVIHSNGGAGIALIGSGNGNLISQNSFYANGTNAPALGIDISSDGVTINDLNDTDGGPNGSLNFPIISGVYGSATSLTVEGWSRPGATLEFFMTDINEGTASAGDNQLGLLRDYGEGQVYISTLVEGSGLDLDSKILPYTDTDGNTDNTNKFKFTFPLPPGVTIGEYITATATIGNSTSEFSPQSEIRANTLITNKRITYRIKKN